MDRTVGASGTHERSRWTATIALLFVALWMVLQPATAQAAPDEPDDVTLYFFWGDGCPHCAAAEPVLAGLEEQNPKLTVRDFELWYHPENEAPFVAMAEKFGFEPSGVPTIFLGDQYWVGWNDALQREVEDAVAACVADGCPDAGAGVIEPLDSPDGATPTDGATAVPSPAPTSPAAPTDDGSNAASDVITLPVFGEVDAGKQSLVVTTALIALVDGFNPCSLWVLSVLLALTLRTGSRRKTVIIGLVFIFVTALVYALFIAGLFTFFTIVSIAPSVRVLVALVALVFAVVNIKDYFWYKEGISFTISDDKKPGIYRRMRRVIANGDSMPALVSGTVVLAAGVSLVELACTAGFPVLWTNILSDQGVGVGVFLLLLLLYMLIYQLDELVIFGVAVVTLKSSKLEEKHGRILKLVGGMLMLTLAVVMIVDPTLMTNVGSALLVFGIAVAATLLVLLLHRVVLPRLGIHIGSEEKRALPSMSGATARKPPTKAGSGTKGASGKGTGR